MSTSDAARSLAARQSGHKSQPAVVSRPAGAVRLVDAMARAEATWVEAVAVAQAVCAQLRPGDAVPALEALSLTPTGAVLFAPTGLADEVKNVEALGRLLTGILRRGDCPFAVWELVERARTSPGKIGNAQAFRAALTCLPAEQGPPELARFVMAASRQSLAATSAVTVSTRAAGVTARAGMVLLMVAAGAIGAGALVAAATSAGAPAAVVVPADVPR